MKEKNLNLPNVLTMIRLLLIPVTIVLIVEDEMIWAFAVFITACLTDLLDEMCIRDSACAVPHPVLRPLGSKNRMLYSENHLSLIHI